MEFVLFGTMYATSHKAEFHYFGVPQESVTGGMSHRVWSGDPSYGNQETPPCKDIQQNMYSKMEIWNSK